MHTSTFQYLRPTPKQLAAMEIVRDAAAVFATVLELNVPEGADKDHCIRLLRDAGMWANVAITRKPDGTPRVDIPGS